MLPTYPWGLKSSPLLENMNLLIKCIIPGRDINWHVTSRPDRASLWWFLGLAGTCQWVPSWYNPFPLCGSKLWFNFSKQNTAKVTGVTPTITWDILSEAENIKALGVTPRPLSGQLPISYKVTSSERPSVALPSKADLLQVTHHACILFCYLHCIYHPSEIT